MEDLENVSLPRFSWDYDHFSDPDQWFLLATAYLDASSHLLAEMISRRLNDSFHHAKVAMSNFEHSLELFLKGLVAQAGKPVPKHHKTDEILKQCRGLYPGKRFEFTGKIDEAVSGDARWPPNQFARYPVDVRDRPWGNVHIDLSVWYREVKPFEEDFVRIQGEAKKKYPSAPRGSSSQAKR